MNYYHLVDDVHVPGRWYLGAVRLTDGAFLHLLNGQSCDLAAPASVDVTRTGRALDFCTTAFNVPVACKRLADAMGELARDSLEQVPVTINGSRGHVALNARLLVDCVDEVRSTFTRWTEDSSRPDKAGHYRSLSPFHVDSSRVPSDAHFFRIRLWRIGLVISDEMRSLMERVGCTGAKFLDVT